MTEISATTNLAEREADTAPALEDVVSRRAFVHADVSMLEVPAGHTAGGVPRLRATAQALIVAALALTAAGAIFTVIAC